MQHTVAFLSVVRPLARFGEDYFISYLISKRKFAPGNRMTISACPAHLCWCGACENRICVIAHQSLLNLERKLPLGDRNRKVNLRQHALRAKSAHHVSPRSTIFALSFAVAYLLNTNSRSAEALNNMQSAIYLVLTLFWLKLWTSWTREVEKCAHHYTSPWVAFTLPLIYDIAIHSN
jgi:uncharacterized membrane protein